MRTAACALTLLCLALSAHAAHASDVAPPSPPPTALFSNLPLLFVENRGQLDEAVRFSVPGSGRSLYFTRDGITVALEGDGRRWALKLDFVAANPDVVLRGEEAQEAIFSYFKGNDPAKWKAGCPTYAKLVYEDLWPGIDLVYRGEVNRLKHEFVVGPGADARRIRFAVRGATAVRLDADGELVLETPLGSFEDARPIAYQEREGMRIEVDAAFALDGTQVGFTLGAFDPSLSLVLDPETIVYSGFLGGSGDDSSYGIALDAEKAAYVSGSTYSPDFPTVGGLGPTLNGTHDAFVAKVNPEGSALVYSAFLGGSAYELSEDIAVDGAGAAYVIGYTASIDFPTVGGLDSTYNGNGDAFVSKVDPSGGVLAYSGFIGGTNSDWAFGIALKGDGKAYVVGRTDSSDFPATRGPDLTPNGGTDAFISKIDAMGSSLLYSGFIGGSSTDEAYGVAVDAAGAAYVTGYTSSSDFPAVVGPDLTYNSTGDVFVTKVDPPGSTFVYSGYIGGSFGESGSSIAVDGAGAAYVTGYTESADFPHQGGLDPSFNGGWDAFVSKVNAEGTTFDYSGYLGGPSLEIGYDITVDAEGAAYVSGSTATGFPVLGGPFKMPSGGSDGFVTKVNPSGEQLVFSGYLGGGNTESVDGIAVDDSGAVYVTGETYSIDFPTLGDLDPTFNGGSRDAYVAKVFVHPFLFCRGGTVGDPSGPLPGVVLRINGSGGDVDRVVVVTIGSPVVITMDAPPSGPNPAPFAMYGWLGEPNESTATPHPKGLGTMCFPTPVTGGLPQPNRIWNNIGRYQLLGYPNYPSEPAPSTPLSKIWGIPFAVNATFQGIIFDDGSAADRPVSITNAVILKLIP